MGRCCQSGRQVRAGAKTVRRCRGRRGGRSWIWRRGRILLRSQEGKRTRGRRSRSRAWWSILRARSRWTRRQARERVCGPGSLGRGSVVTIEKGRWQSTCCGMERQIYARNVTSIFFFQLRHSRARFDTAVQEPRTKFHSKCSLLLCTLVDVLYIRAPFLRKIGVFGW